MRTFDGLKLTLQFYDNHGQLHKVSKKSGVPMKYLFKFIDEDILSKEHRTMLEKSMVRKPSRR